MKEMNENSGQAFDDFVRESIDKVAIGFNPSAWEELSAQLDVFDNAMIHEKKTLYDKLKSWMTLSLNSFFAALLGLGALFVVVVSAEGSNPRATNGLIEQFNQEVEMKGIEPENNPIKNGQIPIEPTLEKAKESQTVDEKQVLKKGTPILNEVHSSDSIPLKDTIKKKDVFIFW